MKSSTTQTQTLRQRQKLRQERKKLADALWKSNLVSDKAATLRECLQVVDAQLSAQRDGFLRAVSETLTYTRNMK